MRPKSLLARVRGRVGVRHRIKEDILEKEYAQAKDLAKADGEPDRWKELSAKFPDTDKLFVSHRFHEYL